MKTLNDFKQQNSDAFNLIKDKGLEHLLEKHLDHKKIIGKFWEITPDGKNKLTIINSKIVDLLVENNFCIMLINGKKTPVKKLPNKIEKIDVFDAIHCVLDYLKLGEKDEALGYEITKGDLLELFVKNIKKYINKSIFNFLPIEVEKVVKVEKETDKDLTDFFSWKVDPLISEELEKISIEKTEMFSDFVMHNPNNNIIQTKNKLTMLFHQYLLEHNFVFTEFPANTRKFIIVRKLKSTEIGEKNFTTEGRKKGSDSTKNLYDEKNQEIVETIKTIILNSKEAINYTKIADSLNKMKVKTINGSVFNPQQVCRLVERYNLKNPVADTILNLLTTNGRSSTTDIYRKFGNNKSKMIIELELASLLDENKIKQIIEKTTGRPVTYYEIVT